MKMRKGPFFKSPLQPYSPVPDLLVGVWGRYREHVDVVAGERAAEQALRAVTGANLVVLNGGEVFLKVTGERRLQIHASKHSNPSVERVDQFFQPVGVGITMGKVDGVVVVWKVQGEGEAVGRVVVVLAVPVVSDVVPHPTPADEVRLGLGLGVEHGPHAAGVQGLWFAQVDDAEPVSHVRAHVCHL